MGKDNGIIRDGAKGGNWARVVNGALQVRIAGGGGGGSSIGPTTPTTFTAGSVIFSNGTTLAEDNANLFWDNVAKKLKVSGFARLGAYGFGSFGALWFGGLSGFSDFALASDGTTLLVNAPAANDISFQIGNVEKARMLAAGRWLMGGATDDGSSTLRITGPLTVSGNYNGAPTVSGNRLNPESALKNLLAVLNASKIITDTTTAT